MHCQGYGRGENHNFAQNILELYNVLGHVFFATSKTKLDIYYIKLGRRAASKEAKPLTLKKLGK